MYRLILESLLGLQVTDGTMRLAPLLPEGWTEASLRFRHKSAAYNVTLKKTDGVTGTAASLDGQQVKDGAIPLADDGREHTVEVRLPG